VEYGGGSRGDGIVLALAKIAARQVLGKKKRIVWSQAKTG
jgi:hypothetical protein